MYESPINIYEIQRDIQQKINQDQEEKVLECIHEYGINVDKEELIKALEYSREQYIKGYQDGSEQESQWIPASERLPEANGEYLVTVEDCISRQIDVLDYANDLYEIDNYDFIDKKGVAGWYTYDAEWGCFEIDGVIARMPLPEPYEAESEE